MHTVKSVILMIVVFSIGLNTLKAQDLFYTFGTENTGGNHIQISEPVYFEQTVSHGFDLDSGKKLKYSREYVYLEDGGYFSVSLPEGNYEVTTEFWGDKNYTASIKTESRRLMAGAVAVFEGESKIVTFNVNVRTPRINETESISIKDREKNYLNWDHKLTIEFLGEVAVKSIRISPLNKVTTIFLAGDSTVTDQDVEPWGSWGQFITNYLDTSVVVANYAASGASLSSFKGRKRFEKILTLLQPGDYVFIEFGHNDEKIKGAGAGAWGIYTELLTEFVKRTRELGGIPVLLSPTQRRAFNEEGKIIYTHGDFPLAMKRVANTYKVPFIDLTEKTTRMYESWGVKESARAFVHYPANTFPGQTEKLEDNTHFNSFGANEIALCVLQGIHDLQLDLSQHIKDNFRGYDPMSPNNFSSWTLPASPRYEIKKPDGN